MRANRGAALSSILASEGQEVNRSPDEPGGISRWGVSLTAYAEYCASMKMPAPIADTITGLSESAAEAFYTACVLVPMRFDDLPSGVDYRLADITTSLGLTGGIEALELALGMWPLTGAMSDTLVARVLMADPRVLIGALSGAWITSKRNAGGAEGWAKYGRGWTNRNVSATKQAVSILAAPSPPAKSTAPASAPAAAGPAANTWPLQSQCPQFYGDPATPGWLQANTTDVVCPWPLLMDKIPVSHITIHKKCAASLTRILAAIWDAVGHDLAKIQQLRYDQYNGSYNYRPIRGSTGGFLSMHAYAAAIDWDAEDNQQHSTRHLFQDDSLIVVKFKEEGAIWGGDWSPSSIDAMHFQFARVN